jgi:hypothetical protein
MERNSAINVESNGKPSVPTSTIIVADDREALRPGIIIHLRQRIWRVERIDGGVQSATPDGFGAPS